MNLGLYEHPLCARLSVVLVLIGQATADEQVSLLLFPVRLLSQTCGIREDRLKEI